MNQRRLDAESMPRHACGIRSSGFKSGRRFARRKDGRKHDSKQLEELRKAELDNRSIYLPVARQAIPEVLKTFDFAEPSIIVGRRGVTTVPTQALFLLNSDFVIAQAKAFVNRIEHFADTDPILS